MPEVNHPRRAEIGGYYQNKKPRQLNLIKRWLIIITVIIVGQSLFQVPFLRLSNITIDGIKYIPSDQLENEIEEILDRKRWFIFRNDNYFLFQSYDLIQRLENEYHLTDIKLTKKFPQTLSLTAKERLSPFVRQTPEGYYAMNFRGEVLGQIDQPEPTQIIIADERTDQSQGIPLDYLETATNLLQTWAFKAEQLHITKFHLTDSNEDLKVTTSQNYRVFFTRGEDITVQLARLQEILSQDAVPETIEYIDLRFENNIYYK